MRKASSSRSRPTSFPSLKTNEWIMRGRIVEGRRAEASAGLTLIPSRFLG
jgi:hypothetical protein